MKSLTLLRSIEAAGISILMLSAFISVRSWNIASNSAAKNEYLQRNQVLKDQYLEYKQVLEAARMHANKQSEFDALCGLTLINWQRLSFSEAKNTAVSALNLANSFEQKHVLQSALAGISRDSHEFDAAQRIIEKMIETDKAYGHKELLLCDKENLLLVHELIDRNR